MLTPAFTGPDDIKENAVRIISGNYLTNLLNQDVQVRRIKAKLVVAGRHEIFHPARTIFRVADQPFGMAPRQLSSSPADKYTGVLTSISWRRQSSRPADRMRDAGAFHWLRSDGMPSRDGI